MINSLSLFPDVLIAEIIRYADSEAKRELSTVDRRIHALVLKTVRCIRVFPPSLFSSESPSPNIPEDILVRVIRRYPILEKITFGPRKGWSGRDEFGAKEVPYLKSLISYLESDPEKRLLSSVKKMECREIQRGKYGRFERFDGAQAKELNNHFLSAIGHKGLEKVSVKADTNGSILTGNEIQPVLTNSPNLKIFVFDGFQSYQPVSLSFAGQSHLTKVKLLDWRGPTSTIASLKSCKELEELVIEYKESSTDEIKAILSGDHSWNLKRLELKGVTLRNDQELDAITKKLPNLEWFVMDLENISDEGMEQLSINCPQLRVLRFKNENLTNSALAKLTQRLPHLEVIDLELAYKITEEGIAAVAKNCKKLQFILVVNYKKIEKTGIEALVKHCPHLKGVEFTFGGPLSLEGMHDMAEKMPNLLYVNLYDLDLPEKKIQEFYKKFPHLQNILFFPGLKKLYTQEFNAHRKKSVLEPI